MALRIAVASGNWSNPAIWNGGVLPNPGDVVASNNFTVTIDQNINVDSITNAAQAVVDAVPNMTSPTTPFGIITESTTVSGFEGWKAFDGSSSLEWRPSGQQWVAYEFPTPKAINQYYFTGDTTKNSWKFEAWDGTNWITLHTITGASTTAYTSPLLGNSTQYIKYRFFTLDSIGHRFREIDFYEYLGTSSAVAGGGFICATSNTITLTGVNTTNGCLIGASVLRWTGGAGITTNLNVTFIREYGNTLLIEGTGTFNFTGSIYNVIPNTSIGVVYITGACTFNMVGTLSPQSGSNQPEGTQLIYVGAAATLNITGSLISTVSAGCCIRVVATNAIINITGDLSNTSNLGYNGNLIIISSVCTVNITGNSTGRVFTSSSAGYLKIIGSITASNFNGQIAVLSTNSSGINIFSGPFICSTYGTFPYQCVRMHLIPTTSSYIEFRDETTNGAGSPAPTAPATQLVSPATLISNLATSDVRFGVVYALGTLTGTLRMPTANQVTFGVAVDNTFGASVLTAASIWDYLVSNITTADSIGMRLKNVSTPQTTGEQLEAFLRLD